MQEKLQWLLHDGTGSAVLIGCGFMGLLLIFFGMFGRRAPEAIELDEVRDAINLLEMPRPTHGGKWMKFKVAMVECEAPMKQGDITIGTGTAARRV